MDYSINEVWPVNTDFVPNGGIGVNWSGPIGFGQFILYWQDDELHVDTEYLSTNEDRNFIKTIFNLLADKVIVD